MVEGDWRQALGVDAHAACQREGTSVDESQERMEEDVGFGYHLRPVRRRALRSATKFMEDAPVSISILTYGAGECGKP